MSYVYDQYVPHAPPPPHTAWPFTPARCRCTRRGARWSSVALMAGVYCLDDVTLHARVLLGAVWVGGWVW